MEHAIFIQAVQELKLYHDLNQWLKISETSVCIRVVMMWPEMQVSASSEKKYENH